MEEDSSSEKDCITINKRGITERREYVCSGKFLLYKYEAANAKGKGSKLKIVLKNSSGEIKEYYIIPTRDNRYLTFQSEEKGDRGIYRDGKCMKLSDFL